MYILLYCTCRDTAKVLENIKDIAIDIGKELDEHDEIISRIEGNAEEDTQRLKQVTERLKKQ